MSSLGHKIGKLLDYLGQTKVFGNAVSFISEE